MQTARHRMEPVSCSLYLVCERHPGTVLSWRRGLSHRWLEITKGPKLNAKYEIQHKHVPSAACALRLSFPIVMKSLDDSGCFSAWVGMYKTDGQPTHVYIYTVNSSVSQVSNYPEETIFTMSEDHNQPVPDPIAHFESIPWCYRLINDESAIGLSPLDRSKLPDDEGCLMRETLNNQKSIKASVFFLRYPPQTSGSEDNGEDPENPFMEVVALADLGPGVNGFAKTVHGGFFGVLLDETMGSVANMQAGMNPGSY